MNPPKSILAFALLAGCGPVPATPPPQAINRYVDTEYRVACYYRTHHHGIACISIGEQR